MVKRLVIKIFHWDLMQRQWGRKYIGGTFYHIWPRGLSMGTFWSDKEIKSCQSETIATETY